MASTTIRIDIDTLPEHFDRSRLSVVAEVVEAALREDGIEAEASDLFSHIKIELPTAQLAAACAVLAELQLIPAAARACCARPPAAPSRRVNMPLDPAQRHQIEQDALSAAWEADRRAACEAAIALLRQIADLERDDDGDVILGADADGHNDLMSRLKAFLADHDLENPR